MGQKRHTPEQIIRKLRQAEVELAKGQSAVEVARRWIASSVSSSRILRFAAASSACSDVDRPGM